MSAIAQRFLVSSGLVVFSLLCYSLGLIDARPRRRSVLFALAALLWGGGLFYWWSLLL